MTTVVKVAGRVYTILETVVFDAAVIVVTPILLWWVSRGLRRDDLAEEIREYWKDRTA